MTIPSRAARRDLLVALLRDMPGQVSAIDLTGVSSEDKLHMRLTCCADLIIDSILLAADNHADAELGLEILVGDMKQKLKEQSHGDQRQN